MKRMTTVLLTAALFLTACTKEEQEAVREPVIDEQVDHAADIPEDHQNKDAGYKILQADRNTFHFAADWLSDTEIAYVEKRNNEYIIKTFDLQSGESEEIYSDSSFITDLQIHPSKDFLLMHTSNDYESAAVKMIDKEGRLLHEIEIASVELEIEWNAMDPEKILFTAFNDDWSYDVFLFDGHEQDLELLHVDDPFPKWAGADWIASAVTADHPLDGGEIKLIHSRTKEEKKTGITDAVYMDTYKSSILAVQAPKDDTASYLVIGADGSEVASWELPAVSNYSEWVIPHMHWLSEHSLLILSPAAGGQLDALPAAFRMLRMNGNAAEELSDEMENAPFTCSPDGSKCLIGYDAERLIDLVHGRQADWIQFKE